jgi:hypothetical protein
MSFIDAFFGSTQSQFTAYAIFAAIASICISIILTGTDMTIGNRLLLIFFIILAVLPSILLMLLQITCMVTGGSNHDRWWCWLYSWIIAIFVIIYCIFVIIISLSSLFTYNNAINKVDMNEQSNKMSPDNSNNYAKMMIDTNSKGAIERFMNAEDSVDDEAAAGGIIQTFENNYPEMKMPNNENFDDKKIVNNPPLPNKEDVKDEKEKFYNSTPQYPTSIMTDEKKEEEKFKDVSANSHTTQEISNFMTKEMLDEPEPFTNRNYASIM